MNHFPLMGRCVSVISGNLKAIGFKNIEGMYIPEDHSHVLIFTKPDEHGDVYKYRLSLTFEGNPTPYDEENILPKLIKK